MFTYLWFRVNRERYYNRGASLSLSVESLPSEAPRGGQLHLEEEAGVLDEGAEDEEDADDDPRLDGSETLGLRDVGRDRVEDVHQHQEDCHEQCHPPRHDV